MRAARSDPITSHQLGLLHGACPSAGVLTDTGQFPIGSTPLFRQRIKVVDRIRFSSKSDKLLFVRIVECPIISSVHFGTTYA